MKKYWVVENNRDKTLCVKKEDTCNWETQDLLKMLPSFAEANEWAAQKALERRETQEKENQLISAILNWKMLDSDSEEFKYAENMFMCGVEKAQSGWNDTDHVNCTILDKLQINDLFEVRFLVSFDDGMRLCDLFDRIGNVSAWEAQLLGVFVWRGNNDDFKLIHDDSYNCHRLEGYCISLCKGDNDKQPCDCHRCSGRGYEPDYDCGGWWESGGYNEEVPHNCETCRDANSYGPCGCAACDSYTEEQ